MKLTQSILEKAMYLLLILLFVSNFFVAAILYNQSKQIKSVVNNQDYFTQAIKKDQASNALAIKTYIACLLAIPSTTATDQIAVPEQLCFDKAPPVK